jgi:hypothetical protein
MSEANLFHQALEKAPGERVAFLDAACVGRPELRAALEALLPDRAAELLPLVYELLRALAAAYVAEVPSYTLDTNAPTDRATERTGRDQCLGRFSL